jgi:putative GTP pyrophosphokinase
MDFWASLDHQLRYKKDIPNVDMISARLKKCADVISATDLEMQSIKNSIYGQRYIPELKRESPKE